MITHAESHKDGSPVLHILYKTEPFPMKPIFGVYRKLFPLITMVPCLLDEITERLNKLASGSKSFDSARMITEVFLQVLAVSFIATGRLFVSILINIQAESQ